MNSQQLCYVMYVLGARSYGLGNCVVCVVCSVRMSDCHKPIDTHTHSHGAQCMYGSYRPIKLRISFHSLTTETVCICGFSKEQPLIHCSLHGREGVWSYGGGHPWSNLQELSNCAKALCSCFGTKKSTWKTVTLKLVGQALRPAGMQSVCQKSSLIPCFVAIWTLGNALYSELSKVKCTV